MVPPRLRPDQLRYYPRWPARVVGASGIVTMQEVRRIQIDAGDIVVTAELGDSETADGLWEALPITSTASTWGDEIYFSVPVDVPEGSEAQAEQEVGAVCYWPTGRALCVFFGPTPASVGNAPAAISPVNAVGMIEGDALCLKAVRSGDEIKVQRA